MKVCAPSARPERKPSPSPTSSGPTLQGPTFEVEDAEMALGCGLIAGVDEAGRGPWAGPVVAAAVILDPDAIPPGLDDSKKMTPAEREIAFTLIVASARVGVGVADVARIDRDNILQATLWAMRRAVGRLPDKPELVLIDGNRLPTRLGCKARAIVEGDAKCLSIAAASIVAKVTRDRMMIDLATRFPGYGFEQHKGYGVPEHQAAIARLGPTRHHRRSFRPIQLALQQTVTRVAGGDPGVGVAPATPSLDIGSDGALPAPLRHGNQAADGETCDDENDRSTDRRLDFRPDAG